MGLRRHRESLALVELLKAWWLAVDNPDLSKTFIKKKLKKNSCHANSKVWTNNMPASTLDCLGHSFEFGPNRRTTWHPFVNKPTRAFWRRRRFSTSRPGWVNKVWHWESPLGPNYDLIDCLNSCIEWETNIEWSAMGGHKMIACPLWPYVPYGNL